MRLGFIGLGKMGIRMVARLREKGHGVITYDVNNGQRDVQSIEELIKKLDFPHAVWLMVPHDAVDGVLGELEPFLNAGDAIFEGGNSFYKDSRRRSERFAKKEIKFIDVGVSGGPGGAREGACVMVGGNREDFDKFEGLFRDIAAPDAYGYMGKAGAGHFVKMIHNGIEYGMMQAIAEGFSILKESPYNLDLKEISRVYGNQSVISSRLVDWLRTAYEAHGDEFDGVSGKVAHTGEGAWTVETAKEFGIPVPIIEEALRFRKESSQNPSYTGKILTALRNQFGGHGI